MMNADGFAGFSRRQQRIGTRGISPVPGACLPVGVVVETDDSLQNNEGRSDWRTSPDRCGHVRFTAAGMSADGSGLARLFFTFAGWSVQPCVRPVCAVHMTAGHNAFRGSGPDQKPAFEMHWHKWVVLIAGSTGSALRAVGPPNLHITPDVGAIGHAASATGSL